LPVDAHQTNEDEPIVLVGPTGVGKTEAALELAERLDAEIINADSMQVYVGMDIGTAKPDAEARRRVRFHLIDEVEPGQPYNAADWMRGAERALQDIASRRRRALICGGTGMYVRALLDGWSLANTPADARVRAEIRREAELHGAAVLYAQLRDVDPMTAARLHPNDLVRIERAIEVYRVSGIPMSRFRARDAESAASRRATRLGMTRSREALYARIDSRVDAMLAAGLEAEVRALHAKGYGSQHASMRSLGYKEIGLYLSGDLGRSEAVSAMKQHTRQFAKRQMTWFRGDSQIHWIEVSEESSATVADRLLEAISDLQSKVPMG
jgi:tRNA dimethylallyltransferase